MQRKGEVVNLNEYHVPDENDNTSPVNFMPSRFESETNSNAIKNKINIIFGLIVILILGIVLSLILSFFMFLNSSKESFKDSLQNDKKENVLDGKNSVNDFSIIPTLSVDNGMDGLKGDNGERGPAARCDCSKSEPGLPGIPGPKGDRGLTGPPGEKGLSGRDGIKGDSGLQGHIGPPGLTGLPGMRGMPGLPGIKGETGLPGQDGRSESKNDWSLNGFFITRHSQKEIPPDCPINTMKLWDGFSFVYFEGFDLGSCSKNFNFISFVECDKNNICKSFRSIEAPLWLGISKPITDIIITAQNIKQLVSRCSVCEAPSNVIAVHSQSEYIPECPENWNRLWDGYSFIVVN